MASNGKENEDEWNLFYKPISLTLNSIFSEAKDMIELIHQAFPDEELVRVKCIPISKGDIARGGYARVFLSNSQIKIPYPDKEKDKAKLSSVLYVAGRLEGADTEVISDYSTFWITTKHAYANPTNWQKQLDTLTKYKSIEEIGLDGAYLCAPKNDKASQSLKGSKAINNKLNDLIFED